MKIQVGGKLEIIMKVSDNYTKILTTDDENLSCELVNKLDREITKYIKSQIPDCEFNVQVVYTPDKKYYYIDYE